MSSTTSSVQDSQEVNSAHFTQDPQKSTSLYGRAFHKISNSGKCIIQSINNVAQSILSKCISLVSFGRYNLDSLKSYLFPNQTVSKGDETASSNNLPTRSAPLPPPPPKMPTSDDLNRASSSRFSAKVQSSTQESITPRVGSVDVRSGVNSTQNISEEDDNTLEDGANSRSTLGSPLHKNSDSTIEGENNNEPNVSPQKKTKGIQKKMDQGKQVVGNLFAGVKDSPLFRRMKEKVNQ